MSQKIDTWYGCRFVNSTIITQFFFDGAGILNPYAHFYNISPEQFDKSTQRYIVAVWHIKPYSSKLLKLNRVILAIHNSPNKSTQRAALWCRLIKLRATLVN